MYSILLLSVQSLFKCFLTLALRTLSFSFLNVSPSHSKALLLGISPYQHTALSFSKGRHDRIHKLTSSRAILCYTADIPFSDAHFGSTVIFATNLRTLSRLRYNISAIYTNAITIIETTPT